MRKTRDLGIARIRYLETALRIERDWVQLTDPLIEIATACAPIARAAKPIGKIASVSLVAGPVVSKAELSIRSIFKSYAAEAQLASSTVKRWMPVVERLTAHLGHGEATRISRADIVAWKNALLVENRSVNASLNGFVHLGSMSGWRQTMASGFIVLSIPEDVRNIIQGHAGAKVSDRYGETWAAGVRSSVIFATSMIPMN